MILFVLQEKTYCQTSTIYKMDFEKIGKSYSFSFDLYPKGDAKSEDDIALYIKVRFVYRHQQAIARGDVQTCTLYPVLT